MRKKLKITEDQFKRLKENLINEDKFSWDGKYANEDVDEGMVGMPGDMEFVDEKLEQPEPTDVENSQWFSDVDGNRLTDKDSR